MTEPCRYCGKPRPAESGQCPHCGANRPRSPATPSAPGGALPVRPLSIQRWFDARSPHDRKLLLRDDLAYEPVEADHPEGLRLTQDPRFQGRNRTVVYQQWGPLSPEGARPYYWFDMAAAEGVAATLAGGPTRELIIIATKFQPGALGRFARSLTQVCPGGQLEMLGLFWYLSGDDLTDDPPVATELAEAAARLGVRRLSILTGAFGADCEARLAAGLRGNRTLERLGVFLKDDAKTWPLLETPHIAAALRRA